MGGGDKGPKRKAGKTAAAGALGSSGAAKKVSLSWDWSAELSTLLALSVCQSIPRDNIEKVGNEMSASPYS